MTEPTVFDEIFSRLTPESIFKDSRSTGAGVSVAVIDSGVERGFSRTSSVRLALSSSRSRAIFRASGEPLLYSGHQSSPHGTTVADIILTLALA